jgi:hypothetical protein
MAGFLFLSIRKNLPWIENAMRIKHLLDGPLQGHFSG